MGPGPWLRVVLVLFLPFAWQVCGNCGEQGLRTDGWTFKFTIDVRFHSYEYDNGDMNLLNSSTGALLLYGKSNRQVYYKVINEDGSRFQDVNSNGYTTLMTWHTLTVEKSLTHICLTLDNLATRCRSASSFHMDPGTVTLGNQNGVEVRHFLQEPVTHAQNFSYNASTGKLFQYFLVGIMDRGAHAERNDYADSSDPTLGHYTKPKFGSFTRLRYDCGYQFGGVLGYIEIEGNWTWDPTPGSADTALMVTHGTATLVEQGVYFAPYLPGYEGDGQATHQWSNRVSGRYPTMGTTSWKYLDGFHSSVNVHACDPSKTTNPGATWKAWAASPNGTQDTNKFVRVWLGQEVAGPDTTATTTGTCTTTTTATETTSTNTGVLSITSTTSSSSSSSTSTTSASTTSTSVTSTSTTSTSTSTTSRSTTSTSTSSATSTTSSTSTSSTSITTSTTSSSTVSTTTTTSSTTTTMDVSAVLAWVSRQETALVDAIFSNPNITSVSTKLPGLTLVAFAMRKDTDTALEVEGSEASLKVPASVLGFVGEESAVGVASVFDSEFAATVGPLRAALNMNLFNAEGNKMQVKGITEPFIITLPVNRSSGIACGYFDVTDQEWTNKGMTEVLPPEGEEDNGLLVCSATHLTLFGAVLKGFLKAFNCAQVSLLSLNAAKRLFKGDWWYQPVALIFWGVELMLAVMLAAACVLDLRRKKKGLWDDEYFLIPLRHGDSDAVEMTPDCPEVEGNQVEEAATNAQQEEPEMEGEKTLGQRCKACLCATVACALMPFNWCYQSSACRDALDDVCSRWFAYFGEVRGFIESICENINPLNGTCAIKTICSSMAGSMVRGSVQRQVSASLGLSDEVVSFFMEDEDLAELLVDAAMVSQKLQEGAPKTKWEERLLAWHQLHQRIVNKFDEHWHQTGWLSFPLAFLRLFAVANPFSSVYLGCHFLTSSQRVLFFAAELCGAMMMVTLFYQVSGSVPQEDVDPECLEGPGDIWEEIGRIIAIALGSIVVANLPVMVLESLHSRSFRKFDYAGCPEWKRQLRAWKTEDILIWVVGLAYVLFCGLFVSLFLANVARSELWEWGMTEGLSFAEDCVIIPLALSLLVPFFAGLSLTCASATAGVHSSEILRQQKAELEEGDGNWKPYVMSI